MIIDIGEYKFPDSVDREKVEEFARNVVRPACKKAGFKGIRFGWVVGEEEKYLGIFIGEMDSLEDLATYQQSVEHQEFHEEVAELFPGVEEKVRIVQVIE